MGWLNLGRRWPLVAAAFALVAFLTVSVLSALVGQETAREDLQATAVPLAALCDVDPSEAARVGANCEQARELARAGVDGTDGRDGAPGRGILGTTLSAGGRLVVAYSDGTTEDVGQVAGDDGVGITATTIEGGRMLVAYSDGRRVDLGPVVGPRGIGVAEMDGSTGRLLVTLTDGSVLDAGPLPPGPAGRDGEDGTDAPVVQTVTRTYADGSVEQCRRTGGTDVDPVFTCDRTPPPTPEGSTPTATAPTPPPIGG